jgi:single-strand DNA-binding protein
MMSLAKIVIAGTVSASPEKRFTQNNLAVTVFNIVVPPSGTKPSRPPAADEPPTLLKVVCMRQLADLAEPLQTGQAVMVEGALQINTVQQPDGAKKKQFEVMANNLFVLPSLPTLLKTENGVSAPQGSGGGMNNNSGFKSNNPVAPTAPTPVASPAGTGFQVSDLSADEFLTEDDIPF